MHMHAISRQEGRYNAVPSESVTLEQWKLYSAFLCASIPFPGTANYTYASFPGLFSLSESQKMFTKIIALLGQTDALLCPVNSCIQMLLCFVSHAWI